MDEKNPDGLAVVSNNGHDSDGGHQGIDFSAHSVGLPYRWTTAATREKPTLVVHPVVNPLHTVKKLLSN